MSSVSKCGTNVLYKCKDNQSMSGTQVKLTFTFSAMGTCFLLVCTISGLTKREMPTGQEFIHVNVPGLCIGGGGVNINNDVVGHVLFMRNTEGLFVGNNIIGSIDNSPNTKPYLFQLIVKSLN
jgi:hypothetical protein